jgi:hypothetical protein
MALFDPKFHITMQGRAIARYLGPRDPDSLRELIAWCKRERVRGQLQFNFSQGGISEIVLDEVRRMTEER